MGAEAGDRCTPARGQMHKAYTRVVLSVAGSPQGQPKHSWQQPPAPPRCPLPAGVAAALHCSGPLALPSAFSPCPSPSNTPSALPRSSPAPNACSSPQDGAATERRDGGGVPGGLLPLRCAGEAGRAAGALRIYFATISALWRLPLTLPPIPCPLQTRMVSRAGRRGAVNGGSSPWEGPWGLSVRAHGQQSARPADRSAACPLPQAT